MSQVSEPENTRGWLNGSFRVEQWGLQCGWSADMSWRENMKLTLTVGAGTAGEQALRR